MSERLTKEELSHELAVEIRTVENWMKKGLPSRLDVRGTRQYRTFELGEVEEWLKAREGGEGAIEEKAEIDVKLARAELRRRHAQAEKLEMEVALKRGSLVKLEDVRTQMLRKIQTAKARLLAMPAEASASLEGLTAPEIQLRLTESVERVLADFAAGVSQAPPTIPEMSTTRDTENP